MGEGGRGDGSLGGLEFGGGERLRHEENTFRGDARERDEFEDLGEIVLVADDEFEVRLSRCGERGEDLRLAPCRFRHARVGEFRGDVDLVESFEKGRPGKEGSIGLDFEPGAFPSGVVECSHQADPRGFLDERLAAGENETAAGKARRGRGDGFDVEIDDLFGTVILLVGRIGVPLVGKRRVVPVPGVVGVAPAAMEIAERCPDEDRRTADATSFPLEGEEQFGSAIGHAREFHGG